MLNVIIFYRYYHVTHAVFGPMWIHDYVQCEAINAKNINLLEYAQKHSGLSENLASNMEVTGMSLIP